MSDILSFSEIDYISQFYKKNKLSPNLFTSSTSYVTVLSVTGSGTLLGFSVMHSNPGTTSVRVTIDSVVEFDNTIVQAAGSDQAVGFYIPFPKLYSSSLLVEVKVSANSGSCQVSYTEN